MQASKAQLAAARKPAENGHVPDGKIPSDEVESVKAEVVDEAKMVDWHGLALTLPPKLPASMMFDMTEAEVEGDDAAAGGSAAVHAVYKLLGKEQWAKAKRHSDEIGLSADDFADFVNAVFKAYGMGGSGESSASVNGSESDGG